jgi:GDP-D-mannose dehydratase
MSASPSSVSLPCVHAVIILTACVRVCRWEGEIESIEEIGVCSQTGRVLVRVDARYFRPAEVEILHGTPAKAERVLGWKRTVTFDELIAEMVASVRS